MHVLSCYGRDRLDACYTAQLTENTTGNVLNLTIKLRVSQKDGNSIPVNLCKLELLECDDHARTIRSMLGTLVSKVKLSIEEREREQAAYDELKRQLLVANVRVCVGMNV